MTAGMLFLHSALGATSESGTIYRVESITLCNGSTIQRVGRPGWAFEVCAVLELRSKDDFQAKMTIKMGYFWEH